MTSVLAPADAHAAENPCAEDNSIIRAQRVATGLGMFVQEICSKPSAAKELFPYFQGIGLISILLVVRSTIATFRSKDILLSLLLLLLC